MKGLIDLVKQQLSRELPLDVLLVIGPGRVGDLAGVEMLAQRVLLIDADNSIVQANQAIIGNKPSIESCHAVLSAKPGEVKFRRYNFPRFNSISESGAVPSNIPNLRLIDEVTLQGQTLDVILGDLGVSVKNQKVGLILDVGTTGPQVLQNLQNECLDGLRLLAIHLALETSKTWEKSLLDSAERQSLVYKTRGQAVLQQGVNWLFERFAGTSTADSSSPTPGPAVSKSNRPTQLRSGLVIKTPVDDSQSSSRKREELDSALKAALGDMEGLSAKPNEPPSTGQQPQLAGAKPSSAIPELDYFKGQTSLLSAQLEQSQAIRYELEARLKKLIEESEDGVNRTKLRAAEDRIQELEIQTQELSRVREENNSLRALLEELQERQRLFNEEVVKGEAQLELIKDLLFREPGR